jgi:hypothetical protein
MNMGTVMHSLLDFYYKKRSAVEGLQEYGTESNYMTHVKESVEEYVKSEVWKELLSEEDLEFVIKRFTFYAINYTGSGTDFKVKKNESGEAGVELGFAKELARIKTSSKSELVFIVEGRIDLLIQTQSFEGDAFVDHKTQDREGTLYKYTPQFRTYAWATGMKYGIVNYIGFQKTGTPALWFKREIIPFSPYLIREWEGAMKSVFFDIVGGGSRKQNLGSCSGAFNKFPCQFTKICETESQELRESIIQVNYIQGEKWRPW